jgi:hypothetical protein
MDTLVEVTDDRGRSAPIRARVVQGRPVAELLRAAGSAQLLVPGGLRWRCLLMTGNAGPNVSVADPVRTDELIAAADAAMDARKKARKEARNAGHSGRPAAGASALGSMALGVRRDRHVPPVPLVEVRHGYSEVQALNIADSAAMPPKAVR